MIYGMGDQIMGRRKENYLGVTIQDDLSWESTKIMFGDTVRMVRNTYNNSFSLSG